MRQRLLFVGLRRISERRIERQLGRGLRRGGGNDITKTHVNLLVPRGSASVTTWRAIV